MSELTSDWFVFFTLILSTGLSAFCVGLVRRQALVANILDRPNYRSLHTKPTPTGGGIAIIGCWAVLTLILVVLGKVPNARMLAILPPAVLIAAISYCDDRYELSARVRLVIQVLAVLWFIALSGERLTLGIDWIDKSSLLSSLITGVGMIWLINLFNFMDGIDGIAGMEAVFIALALALFAQMTGQAWGVWMCIVLAGACLGFLIWNWPPTKIFMGDAGSAGIGFLLGALSIAESAASGWQIWPCVILLGVFLVDATVTLIRRILDGQKWYEAHCSHAYQKLSRQWGGHRPVTVGVLVINVCWLLPMAIWAALRGDGGAWIAAIAYLPLICISLYVGAGRADIGINH